MNYLVLAFIIATVSFSSHASAQAFSLFRLQSSDENQLNSISNQYEIVARNGDFYEIYVPKAKTPSFQSRFPSAKLLKADADADWREALKTETIFAAGYHNWQGVQDFMNKAVADYPNLVTKYEYGKSKQGYALSYLRIGSKQSANPAKPKLFLDSATHGDELISVEVLLALTEELLQGYGKDERLTAMLDKADVYVAYVVNPDGFVKQQRYDNGVDPNRSYPWPGDLKKQPTQSIKALMDLFAKERFVGSMSFHAYGKLLMFPWAYTRDVIADATDLADFDIMTDKLTLENKYIHGPISEVIYIAKGSSADYYYWQFGTKALAVELSTSKVPPSSQIRGVVNEAREMVWDFIEHFYL